MERPLILAAKPAAQHIYQALEIDPIFETSRHTPCLATILVGQDAASQVYVAKKGAMCGKLGIKHCDVTFDATVTQAEIENTISKLNEDPSVHGILIQKPLPDQLDGPRLFEMIHPLKDVDGFTTSNAGSLALGRPRLVPCTPLGVTLLLKHYGIHMAGQHALVIGRSEIVGRPMAQMLLINDCTVTIAHSRTPDLAPLVAQADIVVAAMGKPLALGASLPWKGGVTVIDVGIHRIQHPDGSAGPLVGDVDAAGVAPLVGALSPVPGGVGPMTIASLMLNTLKAAQLQQEIS